MKELGNRKTTEKIKKSIISSFGKFKKIYKCLGRIIMKKYKII